jgi:hypothetical protein
MTADDRYLTVTIARRGILTAAVLLAAVSVVAFAYVGIHELSYAGSHPYAYGPAKIIAVAAGAGALYPSLSLSSHSRFSASEADQRIDSAFTPLLILPQFTPGFTYASLS